MSRDREGVAQLPFELGDVREVHPIDGRDHGGREQDRRPSGDPFHLLVLVVSGLAEAGQLVVLSLRDERGVHGEDVAE
jgi:hypothetical protein